MLKKKEEKKKWYKGLTGAKTTKLLAFRQEKNKETRTLRVEIGIRDKRAIWLKETDNLKARRRTHLRGKWFPRKPAFMLKSKCKEKTRKRTLRVESVVETNKHSGLNLVLTNKLTGERFA